MIVFHVFGTFKTSLFVSCQHAGFECQNHAIFHEKKTIFYDKNYKNYILLFQESLENFEGI